MNTLNRIVYREHTLELVLSNTSKIAKFTALPDFLKDKVIHNMAIVDINGQKTILGNTSLDVQSNDVGNCYLRLIGTGSNILHEGYINGYSSYPTSGNHLVTRGVSVGAAIDKNMSNIEISDSTLAIMTANPTIKYSLLVRFGFFENIK